MTTQETDQNARKSGSTEPVGIDAAYRLVRNELSTASLAAKGRGGVLRGLRNRASDSAEWALWAARLEECNLAISRLEDQLRRYK